MRDVEFLGYLISALITLGGFIGIVIKFTQPINDLRVVIQKLNDTIDSLKDNVLVHDKRIETHGKQIDELTNRVGKMEIKMDMHIDDK